MSTFDFPEFQPRAPWWNGDLQTLRNYLLARPRALDAWPSERLVLPLGDGDALVGTWQRPAVAVAGAKPLVVLVHGLSGCEASFYVVRSAAELLAAGWPVLRLNLRGAGPSRAFSRGHYHAGRSEDLRTALAALPASARDHGVVLVGYSLGGNVVLKLLGEGAPEGVRAGASVSAPIDLAAASRSILRRRNYLYHRHILAGVKREALAPGAEASPEERRAVRAARTLLAFDDVFTAPRHGFTGAADYYARASARPFLDAIAVPTLVIHALDDPWIPGESYTSFPWSRNPRLVPLLPRRGGHVGFVGFDRQRAWHDLCLLRFLAGM
jgi:predicted alpha/beta-fold hydrolase